MLSGPEQSSMGHFRKYGDDPGPSLWNLELLRRVVGVGVPLFSGQRLGNLSGTEHVFGGQTWDQTQFPLLLSLRSYLGMKPHYPPRLQEVSKDNDIFHNAWAK